MRLNYSDDEDFNGQFELWQANCRRSLRGKKGQAALAELEAALLALPEKRLTQGALCRSGDVCAVGALAVHRRVQAGEDRATVLASLEALGGSDEYGDCDHQTDKYAEAVLGVPRLVAWKIVAENDITNDDVWEVHHGPVRQYYSSYKGGIAHVRPMTPEERYERVLAWVQAQRPR